jgi:hypothetical protein
MSASDHLSPSQFKTSYTLYRNGDEHDYFQAHSDAEARQIAKAHTDPGRYELHADGEFVDEWANRGED